LLRVADVIPNNCNWIVSDKLDTNGMIKCHGKVD
jgi:hypothetical protein